MKPPVWVCLPSLQKSPGSEAGTIRTEVKWGAAEGKPQPDPSAPRLPRNPLRNANGLRERGQHGARLAGLALPFLLSGFLRSLPEGFK